MSQLTCVSTEHVPRSDRLMKWKDFVSDHLGCTPSYIRRLESTMIDPLQQSDFCGRLEYGDLGDVHFCRLSTSAHRYSRHLSTSVDARETPRMLILQLGGISHFEHGNFSTSLVPDEMLLVDSGRPFTITSVQGCEQIVMLFDGKTTHYDEGAEVHISSKNGIGRMLNHLITDVYRQYSLLNGQTAKLIGDSLIGLVANAVSNKKDEQSLQHDSRSFKQSRLKSYIEQHLSDPALSIESIAHAANCSVRSLHRTFQDDLGCGISDFIWQRRLARCAEDLRNQQLAKRSITDIAYGWGYSSSSHFSRHFKKAFGMSPRLFRDTACTSHL